MTPPPFRIQAGALRRAVALASPPTRGRTAIPILAHLLLSAEAGRLTLRAHGTDSDCDLVVEAQGAAEDALPALTASAARLGAALALLPPEETVELSQAETGQLLLRAGSVRLRLFTLPAEDFPDWRDGDLSHSNGCTLPAGDLLTLLGRGFFAISTEETRYYLNGTYLLRHLNRLRAVTTDGHRMFVAETAWPAEGRVFSPLILPRRTVQITLDRLRGLPPDTPVTLALRDTHGAVITRGWTLRFKALDGTYPDYTRVIPEADGAPIQVERPAALATLVRTAMMVSTDRALPLRIANGSGPTLTLQTAAPDDGLCEVAVPTDVAAWATNAPHPEFGVKCRYMVDLCRAMPAGFTMRVRDRSSAIHISGPDGLSLLMPMRV